MAPFKRIIRSKKTSFFVSESTLISLPLCPLREHKLKNIYQAPYTPPETSLVTSCKAVPCWKGAWLPCRNCSPEITSCFWSQVLSFHLVVLEHTWNKWISSDEGWRTGCRGFIFYPYFSPFLPPSISPDFCCYYCHSQLEFVNNLTVHCGRYCWNKKEWFKKSCSVRGWFVHFSSGNYFFAAAALCPLPYCSYYFFWHLDIYHLKVTYKHGWQFYSSRASLKHSSMAHNDFSDRPFLHFLHFRIYQRRFIFLNFAILFLDCSLILQIL